jgi:hypothetical protein
LHGLVGDVVRAAEPHTEADPAAILMTYLNAFGSAAGRGPHATVGGEARHGANLFTVLVGASAKGRKGTSWSPVKRIMEYADPAWTRERVLSGLSSGEGLIWALRDPSDVPLPGTKLPDPGVVDKRAFVIEQEFASVLQVAGRQGNTLSPLVRQAWDGHALQTMTKGSPARATDPHVCLLAHITKDELDRRLDGTDVLNGFANRFLWTCVRRARRLSRGGRIPAELLDDLGDRTREALAFARSVGELDFDAEGGERWDAAYAALSDEQPGAFGAVTARAEAQVLRLSLIYALLDRSALIRAEHVESALAVWRYCEDSVAYLFGRKTGNPIADRIFREIRIRKSITRTQINDLFGGRELSETIDRVGDVLSRGGFITIEKKQSTRGRSPEIWSLA